MTDRVRVFILWRGKSGCVLQKALSWPRNRGTLPLDLQGYIEDYLALVADGYKPEGFNEAPVPFCARLVYLGKVLAEWRQPKLSPGFSAESLVTADERPGPGGILAASPHSPVFAVADCPNVSRLAPDNTDSDGVDCDQPNVTRLGHAVLTTD
jgi:hypothetical protein